MIVWPLQQQKLLGVDPVVISYLLQNSDSFQESELLRSSIGIFTRKGINNSPYFSWAYSLLKVHSCT